MAGTEELCFFTVARIQIPAGPGPGTYFFEIEKGSVLEAGQGGQLIPLVSVFHQFCSHHRSELGEKYLTAIIFPGSLIQIHYLVMPRNWCAFMATCSSSNLRKYNHVLAFICKDLGRPDISLFHQWHNTESS